MAERHSTPLTERFWTKVRKGPNPDDCWEWIAGRFSKGYGMVTGDKGNRGPFLAHRVSWELTHGPIPNGLVVCHKCDNHPCVRPDHLFLGTQKDNLDDMRRKGREHWASGDEVGRRKYPERYPIGQDAPQAKLTNQDIHSIREALARRFSIAQSTVSKINLGLRWKHLPRREPVPETMETRRDDS